MFRKMSESDVSIDSSSNCLIQTAIRVHIQGQPFESCVLAFQF